MDFYLTAKAVHLVSMVAWFAGLFYLPRLFVYHMQAKTAETNRTFIMMERRLYRFIMQPAMAATWLGGLTMIALNSEALTSQGWLHAKMLLVFLLTGFHHSLNRYRQDLASGNCQRSAKFFRVYNETPTVILIIVIVLAVFKPF